MQVCLGQLEHLKNERASQWRQSTLEIRRANRARSGFAEALETPGSISRHQGFQVGTFVIIAAFIFTNTYASEFIFVFPLSFSSGRVRRWRQQQQQQQ